MERERRTRKPTKCATALEAMRARDKKEDSRWDLPEEETCMRR